MSLTIDGQANSITSSVGGVNIPATVDTLSVGPSGSYMIANSSGVGIGTLTPQDKLTVLGRIQIQQDSISSGNNRLVFRGQPGSSYRYSIDNNSLSNNFRIFREDDATAANGATYMNIDSAGRVTMPYQPAFRVYLPTGAVNTIITFGATEYNIGNHMNAATGIFTAPIAGRYLFTFAILCGAPMGSYVRINFCKNSTTIDTTLGDALTDGLVTYGSPSMAQIFSLAANDTIRLKVEGSGTYGTSYGSFSGCLIG